MNYLGSTAVLPGNIAIGKPHTSEILKSGLPVPWRLGYGRTIYKFSTGGTDGIRRKFAVSRTCNVVDVDLNLVVPVPEKVFSNL